MSSQKQHTLSVWEITPEFARLLEQRDRAEQELRRAMARLEAAIGAWVGLEAEPPAPSPRRRGWWAPWSR